MSKAYCKEITKVNKPSRMKSYMPAGAELSPMGDIGAKRVAEAAKVVAIKGWGGDLAGTNHLPYRREGTISDQTDGIASALPVRLVPAADKITRA